MRRRLYLLSGLRFHLEAKYAFTRRRAPFRAAVPTPASAYGAVLTVYPKLFRRLADYFRDGNTGLADLPDWMAQQGENDEV